MPLTISVPLKDIQALPSEGLLLDHPARCSRCGASPADNHENHKLKLRIAPGRIALGRQTYRVNQPYRLGIRLCENCALADFITTPESFINEPTPLGTLARLYNRLYSIGGLVGSAGLLLMTNLIPVDSSLGGLKSWWPYITAAGMLLVFTAWIHHRMQQRKIIQTLSDRGIAPPNTTRAKVLLCTLENDNDPNEIPLEIILEDEKWAAECAAHYNWNVSTIHRGATEEMSR